MENQLADVLNGKIFELNKKIEAHTETIKLYKRCNRILDIPGMISSIISVSIAGLIVMYDDNAILKYFQMGIVSLGSACLLLKKYNDYDKKIALHINSVKIYTNIVRNAESSLVTKSNDIESLKTIYNELTNKLSVLDEQQDFLIPEKITPMIQMTVKSIDIFKNSNTLKGRCKTPLRIVPRLSDIKDEEDKNNEENSIIKELTNKEETVDHLIDNVTNLIKKEEMNATAVDNAIDLIQTRTGQSMRHMRNPSREIINKLIETKDTLMALQK